MARLFRRIAGPADRFAGFRGAGSLSLALLGLSCASAPPPPSQFPSARAALDRMRASYACSRGITGEAKLDYFGDEGRIRANMMFAAARPEQIRIDLYSPFGATLSTVTSNGSRFALSDLKSRSYFHGQPSQCNVSRFLGVPVPPHALVQLLAGEAPVLVHAPAQAQIAWQSGAYRIQIQGQHQALESIVLQPNPSDWRKPWESQRVRVLEVEVEQEGIQLYRAEFSGHRAVQTAKPRVDLDGLEADVPPSGPSCSSEVPERIRFIVPSSGRDVEVIHEDVQHNPPLLPGSFVQVRSRGMKDMRAECSGSVWSEP